MAIRLSGLSSGLDTEALVGALMSAQSLKKTKVENEKTKLEWKQTKWAELNTKLYSLYTKHVSKMQLQSSYMTKKASVSDPTKASISANSNAVNGSYTMEIKNIATSQYLTGAKLSSIKSTSQKLTDIDASLANSEITITSGGKSSVFTVTENTTIADFTNALKNAGLNANFDTTQQRFFISSKESGLDNAFSITSSKISDAHLTATDDLKNAVGYSQMSEANKKIVDQALATLETSGVDTDEYNVALESLYKAKFETDATNLRKAQLYSEKYDEKKTAAEEALESNYYEVDADGNRTGIKDSLLTKYTEEYNALTEEDKQKLLEEGLTLDGTEEENAKAYAEYRVDKVYKEAVDKKADTDTTAEVNNEITSADNKVIIEGLARTGATADDMNSLGAEALAKYYGDGAATGFAGTDAVVAGAVTDDVVAGIKAAATAYAGVTDRYDAGATSALTKMGLGEIVSNADGVTLNGTKVNGQTSLASGMALVAASDSEIVLNGATLTSASSTISANGLSIDLTGKTNGEAITFSVSTDVDSVYNSVKDFLKEYNEIMKEMNTLYNAASARNYDPLTKEEKEAMTDDDVKLWEDKIKGSLLRNDTSLNGIMSSMRSAMQTQVEYNGKKYSLASFGIMTSTDYTEGGQYHIYGDADDSVYADKTDKLKTALEQDPDAVVNVLSKIFGNLRSNMNDKMAASKVSSALTFYSDIKMKNDIKSYEEEIKDWEDQLAEMEDSYYKKFTAMETAMAKLQAQQSSLAGLFGG